MYLQNSWFSLGTYQGRPNWEKSTGRCFKIFFWLISGRKKVEGIRVIFLFNLYNFFKNLHLSLVAKALYINTCLFSFTNFQKITTKNLISPLIMTPIKSQFSSMSSFICPIKTYFWTSSSTPNLFFIYFFKLFNKFYKNFFEKSKHEYI